MNRPIPILTGKAAEDFIKKAEEAEKAPKIDFFKEIEKTKRILEKYDKRNKKPTA